jgi:hypothetical protein
MLPSKKNVNVTGRIIARVESLSNPIGKIPYQSETLYKRPVQQLPLVQAH